MPISSWATWLCSSFLDSGIMVSAVGGGLGAGVKARALKFFRFMERGAKPGWSAILTTL